MTKNKIKRIVEELTAKYGEVVLFEYVDYYYRESYEGANNWKVRERIMLGDLIDGDMDSVARITGYDIRSIIKKLGTEEKMKRNFPVKVSVRYQDSMEAWEKMKEEHPEEERKKREAFESASRLFLGTDSMQLVHNYYEIKNPYRRML